MRVSLCVMLATALVLADDTDNRRTKLPYVADAVGNTLPPPSNLPAVVGSPVNLLTPDRYEFYTFDESGELVKRLMTLEEIQTIVAAGEETEGLVTFANENQPTIAFNFSQPPYTKVHNVVTNVQNVLKAQMEAHKNKPHTQPTLDTPDVSDSWSLILPSIFNNTGVDIVPDKISSTFSTPETETIELEQDVDDNSLSKEGGNQVLSSSSTTVDEELKEIQVTEKISTTVNVKITPTSTITTTTQKPTTTTTKPKTTTTIKPLLTTSKPTTIKPTPSKIVTTNDITNKPRVTAPTTIRPPTTSTIKQRTTTTTNKPTTKQNVRTTSKVTTEKPQSTTKKLITTTQENSERNFTRIQLHTIANTISTTDKNTIKYEKISTFIPVSTVAFVIERTTRAPEPTTKKAVVHASTTKRSVITTTEPSSKATTKMQPTATTYKPLISVASYVSSTEKDQDHDKFNSTTVTTQSVSPSTTMSSTEFISIGHHNTINTNKPEIGTGNNNNHMKENEPDFQLFDVAQSFSQIASDLGNERPLPTTNDLLEITKLNDMNLESKENIEIEIPPDVENNNKNKSSIVSEKNTDNFVKISTLDPNVQNDHKFENNTKEGIKETDFKNETVITIETTQKEEVTTDSPASTTIDPILSESMDDLLSQVVNQAPQPIVDTDENSNGVVSTTENIAETTTNRNLIKIEEKKDTDKKIENETSPKPAEFNLEQNSNTVSIQMKESNVSKNVDLNIEKTKLDYTQADKVANHNESYVQISISNKKNITTNESAASTNTIKSNIEESKNGTSFAVQDRNSTEENQGSSPISSSYDNNPQTPNKPSNTKGQLKDESSPINKIDGVSVENKGENSELLPKIDEFKKKIQKVNIDEKELINERNSSWKLISTVTPPNTNDTYKDEVKQNGQGGTSNKDIILDFSKENQGLEITTSDLGEDVAQFTELCNELAFKYWHAMVANIDKKRSFVLSPYSITSMLGMIFMGARGATSGEMNEILKLDDMVTFNPHFTLKNISDSLEMTPVSGVLVSAFVRELFSDRNKGKILTFYKERAQHFYNGHVEEVNFKLISDIIRRRTNLLVKRNTWGKVVEYMKSNSITMQPPLAAFSVNIFQTDCSDSSVEGRDGEMYFVVSPNVRQRRLVPVPAVVYKDGFLAGYDPVLDATAASLGNTIISTLFVMPGQQGNIVHAEDLEALEKRLLESIPITSAWKRLLRTLLPRMGLELQIPRFSHKSIFNISSTLRQMGLNDLFDADKADLGGLVGPSKDLYVSDMIQSTTFVTCGGGVIGEQHHIEEYPEKLSEPQRRRTSRWAADWDEPRDYQRAFHDPHDVGEAMHLPLHLRPRQARLPSRNAQPARLKFDRPFLYFVRHNPTGMILYVGRYNPRLLP